MDFLTAVKTVFSNYVTVSGRAQRSQYWFWVLFSFLGGIVFGIVDRAVFHAGYDPATHVNTAGPIGMIFSVVTLLPSICVGVRRLHDLDKSGWWMLINLIPVAGWIVFLFWACTKGTSGSNRFGPDPLSVPVVG